MTVQAIQRVVPLREQINDPKNSKKILAYSFPKLNISQTKFTNMFELEEIGSIIN